MSVTSMDVFLLAAPQPGIESSVLVSNLAAAFKKDAATIEKMLSRPRNLVKADVAPDVAAKYKTLIEKSGGQCELVEHQQAPSAIPVAVAPPIPSAVPASAPPVANPAATAATGEVPSQEVVQAPAASPVKESVVASAPPVANATASAIGEAAPAAVEKPASTQPQPLESAPVKKVEAPPEIAAEVATVAAEESSGDAACYCVKCGSVIRVGQSKCPKCFTLVTEYVAKNKKTAGLLAFFLGGLGAHRLYLGQWWGIIYLLFFSTLIPSLVAIAEAILFWLTPQKKWDAHYGHVQKSSAVIAAVYVLALVISIAISWLVISMVIPVYRDYLASEKVQASMPLVDDARNKVANYIEKTQTYPSQNVQVGIENKIDSDTIQIISLQNEAILLVVYQLPGSQQKYTILWAPQQHNGQIIWDCSGGSMPAKYRPVECRSPVFNKTTQSATDSIAAETRLAKQLFSEDRRISIRVPLKWEIKNLLPGAVIGSANLVDENYVVVLEDAKIDFDSGLTLRDYSRNIQLQLAENIKDGMVQGEPSSLMISGRPAEQFIFPGVVNGIRIAYIVTLIETDTHFYRVLGWTLESRMEKNKELLQNISGSLSIN